MNYIESLSTVFPWAQNLYARVQNVNPSGATGQTLPLQSYFSIPRLDVNKSENWNKVTMSQLNTVGSLFKESDYVFSQFNNLVEKQKSSLNDLESRIDSVEARLRGTKIISNQLSTFISLDAYNQSFLESESDFYDVFKALEVDPETNLFCLKPNGRFSSIRSFVKSLALVEHEHTSIGEQAIGLSNLVDANDKTHCTKTVLSNKPLILGDNKFYWINGDLGVFDYITLWSERGVKFSEVFVKPTSAEGFYIKSICWSPINQANIFSSTWGLSGASSGSTFSISSTSSTNSYIYQVINLSTAFNTSMASALALATSSYLVDNRLDIRWKTKGQGGLGTVRVTALNSSGTVVEYFTENFVSQSFGVQHQKSYYLPTAAVSAVVEIGGFKETTSFDIDDITGYFGEYRYDCDEFIDKNTVIQLPFLSTTSRVSVVINQPNCKPSPKGISYSWGIGELDLRYTEFMPRGLLLSKPVNTTKEIRKIWLRSVLTSYNSASMKFVVYPFDGDTDSKIPLAPFVFDPSTNTYNEGEVIEFVSDEEYANNLYNQDPASIKFIVNPKTVTEVFYTTNSNNGVTLPKPLHIRRHRINTINSFLTESGANEFSWDPNSETVYGIDPDVVDNLRRRDYGVFTATDVATSISANDILNTAGYIPIRVTIETDSFTAFPDTIGKPLNSIIRVVEGETLRSVQSEDQTRTVIEPVLTFEEWLRSTKLSNLPSLGNANLSSIYSQLLSKGLLSNPQGDRVWDIDNLVYSDFVKAADDAKIGNIKSRDLFKAEYDKLVANGTMARSQASSTTQITSSKTRNIFQTANKPLLAVSDISLTNVYYTESGVTRKLGATEYKVDPVLGLITLVGLSGADATVTADYIYYVSQSQKDMSSYNQASINDFLANSRYITRNMTDYLTGRTPSLRAFNPDILSEDFYPVVEYYVTPDSEIIFNSAFLAFGDLPATIRVEWETLGLEPRFGGYVIRTNPTQSPKIQSLALGYRAASPSYERTT